MNAIDHMHEEQERKQRELETGTGLRSKAFALKKFQWLRRPGAGDSEYEWIKAMQEKERGNRGTDQ
jgi:hypothetical protein